MNSSFTAVWTRGHSLHVPEVYRGYYTVARRYEFYVWVARAWDIVLKIAEDFRRLPKIAKDFLGRPEDISIIYQQI